jgi:hypothetical protein
MTITPGTNGNRVSTLVAVSFEWREVPRGTASALTIQNAGSGDLLWIEATVAPSSQGEPAFIQPAALPPITIRDFASADTKIFVRAFSQSINVPFSAR